MAATKRTKVRKDAGGEQQPAAYRLSDITVKEVSLVDRGANRRKYLMTKSAEAALAGAEVVPNGAGGHTAKTAELEVADKATWTTAYINDLPDSSFLYIEPGGKKDGDGKTTPRALRHFPVRDANGAVDLPHLRNALARIPQSSLSQDVKDSATAAAKKLLASANKVSAKTKAALDARVAAAAASLKAAQDALAGVEVDDAVGDEATALEVEKALAETALATGVVAIDKAGKPQLSATREASLRTAATALNEVLAALDAGKEPPADPPAPPSIAAPVVDETTTKAITALTTKVDELEKKVVTALGKTVDAIGTVATAQTEVKKRVATLEAPTRGGGNGGSPETVTKGAGDGSAWPSDLAADVKKRESKGGSKS